MNSNTNRQKTRILVNDVFNELSEENKRLLNNLKFANKCLNAFIKLKAFIDLNCDKLKSNLDSNDSQEFEDLNKEVEEALNTDNDIEDQQSADEEVVEQKPNVFNDLQDFNEKTERNESFKTNPSIEDNETDSEFIEIRSSDELVNENKSNLKMTAKGIKQFECRYESCNKRFPSKFSLKIHTKTCHLFKEKTFKCDFKSCNKVFEFKHLLAAHKSTHTEGKPLQCHLSGCEFRTNNARGLSAHIKLMHSIERRHKVNDSSNGEQFKCDFNNCGKVFTSKTKVKDHQRKSHTDRRLPCEWPGCDYEAKTKQCITRHQSTVHQGQKFIPKKRYCCDFEGCGRRFTRRSKYESHFNGHKGIKPYVCEYKSCNKRFPSKELIQNHTKYCHLITEKTFKCDFNSCDKTFKTKHTLASHMFSHSQDKVFSCNLPGCQFKTHNPGSLKGHLRLTHSTERRFQCPYEGCSTTGKTNGFIRYHIKTTHSEGLPFVCDLDGCGKAFKASNLLKSHQKTHCAEKELHCDWPGCEYQTNYKSRLDSHKIVHSSQRNFRCDWPQCGKRFKSKPNLTEHLRVHKNDKKYACSWPGCQYRCVFGGNLNKHMRVHQK